MRRCHICGSRRTKKSAAPYLNSGRHAHSIFDGRQLVECKSCRSSWVPDPPTPPELAEYYGDADNYSPGRMQAVDRDEWPIWDSRPVALLTLARMLIDFQPGDRFVDLGPGNGAAISLAPYLLQDPQVGCVEYSNRTIEFLRRHSPQTVIGESITDLVGRWGSGSITMLYSAHCFEHFGASELASTLPPFRRALRTGGALVVEVPFAPPPRVASTSRHTPHLIFFTPTGLRRLLERHGFIVRLCIVGPGSTANSVKWVNRNYPVPDATVVGERLANRLEALNHKDFVSRDPAVLESKAATGVIKCVATPAR